MVNWAQMHDCHFDVDRVPELLARVEREYDSEAWMELGHRLILEHDLVSPASIAALPRLVRLASGSRKARHLVGEIMERAASHHGCVELLAESVDVIAQFGALLDRHLQSRPSDYLVTFRALLAVEEQYHWANALSWPNVQLRRIAFAYAFSARGVVLSERTEERKAELLDSLTVPVWEVYGARMWQQRIGQWDRCEQRLNAVIADLVILPGQQTTPSPLG
ncbi:hypothetical protein [Streptomyces sp. NPDC056191]|uniref:hypothetical protein n=1 Tax=Streptomyces sp. NPDC056191 TaxID=3345742 RepID=UPI0035DC9221